MVTVLVAGAAEARLNAARRTASTPRDYRQLDDLIRE
jgi:hypothetical protein